MLYHDAEVFDYANARGAQAFCTGFVANPELHPHRVRQRGEGEDLIDVAGDVIGSAKEIYDLNRWSGIRKASHAALAQDAVELGVHREQFVPTELQVARYLECVFIGIGLDPHDRDARGV